MTEGIWVLFCMLCGFAAAVVAAVLTIVFFLVKVVEKFRKRKFKNRQKRIFLGVIALPMIIFFGIDIRYGNVGLDTFPPPGFGKILSLGPLRDSGSVGVREISFYPKHGDAKYSFFLDFQELKARSAPQGAEDFMIYYQVYENGIVIMSGQKKLTYQEMLGGRKDRSEFVKKGIVMGTWLFSYKPDDFGGGYINPRVKIDVKVAVREAGSMTNENIGTLGYVTEGVSY